MVPSPSGFRGTWIAAPAQAEAYAQSLYANLRALDRLGAKLILIEMPPGDAPWLAIRDRLERATHAGTAMDQDID
jgi:hypothetical protein